MGSRKFTLGDLLLAVAVVLFVLAAFASAGKIGWNAHALAYVGLALFAGSSLARW